MATCLLGWLASAAAKQVHTITKQLTDRNKGVLFEYPILAIKVQVLGLILWPGFLLMAVEPS